MNKRILVLCLSFSTIVSYGYALGGLGGYLLGKGKPLVIAAGFIGGTICAVLALRIWKVYIEEIAKEDAEIQRLTQSNLDKSEENGGQDLK